MDLKQLEDIYQNESILHRIKCVHEETFGDLVLTNKGVTFLKMKGVLGQGRERLHQFDFDGIHRIGTKTKKNGIYRHGVVIGHRSETSDSQAYYYSCEDSKAVLFLAYYERQKLLLKTPEEISSTIQSLSTFKRSGDLLTVAKSPKMRPYFFAFVLEQMEKEVLNILENRFEVDLSELAMENELHSLAALLHESDSRKITKEQVYNTITDLVSHLIFVGELDGIITEADRYVANEALARIYGPFDMLSDFETIFAQMNEKGLLIWALECPTCFRKVKYPKKGKTTTCQFCGATILAKDVFKRFAEIL